MKKLFLHLLSITFLVSIYVINISPYSNNNINLSPKVDTAKIVFLIMVWNMAWARFKPSSCFTFGRTGYSSFGKLETLKEALPQLKWTLLDSPTFKVISWSENSRTISKNYLIHNFICDKTFPGLDSTGSYCKNDYNYKWYRQIYNTRSLVCWNYFLDNYSSEYSDAHTLRQSFQRRS